MRCTYAMVSIFLFCCRCVIVKNITFIALIDEVYVFFSFHETLLRYKCLVMDSNRMHVPSYLFDIEILRAFGHLYR